MPHFALGEAVPISIHAPHEGERPAPPVDINDLAANFNPRSPRGGATWARLQGTIHRRYFNPRSPRGGATKFAQAVATGFYISIHAPHEGERLGAVSTYRRGKAISIHAPHEGERRIVVIVSPSSAADFNPRSPRGGATILLPRLIFRKNRFQSTLPTRGSDQASCLCRPALSISIHAPHEGERRGLDNIWIRHIHFNPRSPRGGATPPCYSISFYLPISIHAPHEGERPIGTSNIQNCKRDFNPRSPRGGATYGHIYRHAIAAGISIHAPHEGERLTNLSRTMGMTTISIHAPHEGERPAPSCPPLAAQRISIHAPHEGERHGRRCGFGLGRQISIHAPHEGERLAPASAHTYHRCHFNPRSPRGGATIVSLSNQSYPKPFQSTLPTRGSDNIFLKNT